jgi:hypothetical protein
MHAFTGNGFCGWWSYRKENGEQVIMTPAEVRVDRSIIWVPADGSGDFHWPHVMVNEELVELDYDERDV